MNILVTGGAGFIGSHLCERLLGEGHAVVAVDDLSLGRASNTASFQKNPHFQLEIGDINDEIFLDRVFGKTKFDIAFHLAANSDIQRGAQDSRADLERTFLTTCHMLEMMKRHGVKKIVFASTSAIYGPANGKVSEDHGPLMPISSYGACKLASEAFISVAVDNRHVQAWIFRFPNVVGERATHGALYDFITRLRKNPKKLEVLGDGTQCKPYLYVHDLIDGMLFGWTHAAASLNVYNLSPQSRTTVREMAEMTVAAFGSGASISYGSSSAGWVGDVPQFEYDASKMEQLGWKPSRTSNEAVQLAIHKMLEEKP